MTNRFFQEDSPSSDAISQAGKLAVLGGIITIIGDTASTMAAALALEEAAQDQAEQDRKFQNMQNQIDQLTQQLQQLKQSDSKTQTAKYYGNE